MIPCQIDIYVLGPYLFTLNIPNSFEKIIQKDQILLSATSRALATLQVAFGTFPYILSLGADSNEAAELIIGKRSGWFLSSVDFLWRPWFQNHGKNLMQLNESELVQTRFQVWLFWIEQLIQSRLFSVQHHIMVSWQMNWTWNGIQ